MRITLVQDRKGFEETQKEWNRLLAASASSCLFLTWEWLHSWWAHLAGSRNLHLAVIHSGQEVLGLAPLAERPGRLGPFSAPASLEFLGTGSVGSDYLDLIVCRGREEEVVCLLAAELAREKRVLELSQLRGQSCLAARLAEPLQRRGWRLCQTAANVCPFAALAGYSWDSYLASLGPAHRANFRRRLRRLEARFHVEFERVFEEERCAQALALLIQLHLRRRSACGGSDAFHRPALIAFHQEFSRLALRQGWLRLFVLRLDGIPAASIYAFRYDRTFYFYQSGFDPAYASDGVGLVALGLSIKSAIEEGAEEYDFLHGAEPYKFLWAREARPLVRMEIYPPGVRGMLHHQARKLRRAAKGMGRQLLPPAWADHRVGTQATGV